jgi:acyl-CoA synthetase (AMP-forming)/AMP-acid ligase II
MNCGHRYPRRDTRRGSPRGGRAETRRRLDGDDLRAFALGRLAAIKVPWGVEIRRELPKNATGKVLKPPLREKFGYWAAGH